MKKTVRAYTLLEILTVVAIVGVLAAVLLPVLAQAKERSKQAVCASNLRQLYLAVNLYDQGNGDGSRPPPSLDSVEPYVGAKATMTCPSETSILPDANGTYPARVLNINDTEPRSPWRISYAFLADYLTTAELGSWQSYQQSSYTGMLACPWHGSIDSGFESPAWRYLQPRRGPIQRLCFDGHLMVWQRHDFGSISMSDIFYAH